MTTAFYILLAVAPSIIWLMFYLQKDKHPEPNRMVIKIFFWGIMAPLVALGFEILYQEGLKPLSLQSITIIIVGGYAFIEELVKYLVIKVKVLKDPEFDEPIDAMLYMIIAALGFAAAENIILLTNLSWAGESTKYILAITAVRFLGAVLLHALASAIVGYFIAYSLCLKHERKSFVWLGIIIATCLHAIYNYIIMKVTFNDYVAIGLLVILLGSMGIVVSAALNKLNRLRSICKI